MSTFRRKPNIKCRVCETWIYRRPCELAKNNGNVYCSQKCFGLFNRNETPCVVCGTPILASAHKITCSRACANRNRKGTYYGKGRPHDRAVKNQELRRRVIENRKGQCERCSHANLRSLQVHHKVHRKDGGTDDMANLELLCANCHTAEHLGYEEFLESAGVGSLIGLENRGNS